jgi:hypothetical protein
MPTDPSIILAVKPPVIPQLDFNTTFKTLGQLKYLQATTQAKEQEAARAQQLFDETGAGRRHRGARHGRLTPGGLRRLADPQTPRAS